jgi:hypothetical protein
VREGTYGPSENRIPQPLQRRGPSGYQGPSGASLGY